MPNRLEGLSSGAELETKAKSGDNEIGLRNHLEKIRTVLSDKPTKEEIDSAKNFLNSLNELKGVYSINQGQITEESKKELGNLNDEYVIFQETQQKLLDLNKPKTSTEVADKNSSFEKLFSDTKSEMIIKLKGMVSDVVESIDEFKTLKQNQRENIKTAIVAKLTSSGIADSLVGGLSSKLKQYSELLAKKDFKSLLGMFDGDKDSTQNDDENLGKKLLYLLQGEISIYSSFVSKYKDNPNLETVLNSPKNLGSIGADTDIIIFKPTTQEEEKVFLENLETKIKGYDKKLFFAENTKEQIFESVSDLPDFVSHAITKFIAFFASVPFIGGLIKTFLGLNGKDEKDLEVEIGLEFQSRKSTKFLRSYGAQTGPNGEKTESQNNPEIKILKDKDLSSVKNKQLKDFFDYCNKNGINTTGKDFWYNVFENKKVEVIGKDGDKETKTSLEINLDIKEEDFFSDKRPQKSFFEKLNSLTIKQSTPSPAPVPTQEQSQAGKLAPTVAEPTQSTNKPASTQTSSIIPPVTGVALASIDAVAPDQGDKDGQESIPAVVPAVVPATPQALKVKEKELPASVTFNPSSSVATIDGKNYSVGIGYGAIPVKAENISYNNGTLSITGNIPGNFFTDGKTIQFGAEKVKEAFAELKRTNQFKGEDDGYTLTMTEIA